jgi:hypothetical protein
MLRNRRQSGESNMGCLFGLILLAIAGVIAWKLIPVKVKAAEIRAIVENESKSAGIPGHSDEHIRYMITQKAQEDNLPITNENITIQRKSSFIIVDVDYTVPVAFPGYTYQWHIQNHAENPIF